MNKKRLLCVFFAVLLIAVGGIGTVSASQPNEIICLNCNVDNIDLTYVLESATLAVSNGVGSAPGLELDGGDIVPIIPFFPWCPHCVWWGTAPCCISWN